MDRGYYHIGKTKNKGIGVNLISVTISWQASLDGTQNLCKHQLVFVRLVAPFWLAVK
jgi:hypothetical protein